MDSCNINKDPNSLSKQASSVKMYLDSKSVDSSMHINSKDELNWVVNEVVVDDDNLKISNDVVRIGSNTDALNTVVSASEVKASSKCDENEAKLWEYFTEHNSSQLKCNLCSGLFLYQSNASHLLRHVEAAHKIPVLPAVKISSQPDSNVNSSNNLTNVSAKQSDLEDKVAGNRKNNSSGDAKRLSCSVGRDFCDSKTNIKALEYFVKLSSGKNRCNLCFRVLSYRSNEYTMLRHLNINHRDIYQQIFEPTTVDDTVKSKSVIGVEQNETVKNTLSVLEYYKKLEDCRKVQCRICNALLKSTDGVCTNLIRHLKLKHKTLVGKRIGNKCSGKRIGNKCSDQRLHRNLEHSDSNARKKLVESMIVLEIIQDGDNCLITDARLHSESVPIAELTDLPILELSHDRGKSEFNHNTNDMNSECSAGNGERIFECTIWSYFKKSSSNGETFCSLCSVVFRVKSTVNDLVRHLFVDHEISCPHHFESFKNVGGGLLNDKHESVDCEFDNELTTDDIGNKSLSSFVHCEGDDELKIIDKKLKRRGNIMNVLWKYYSKLYRGKAMCNICDKTFTYKLGQTSGLVKHLRVLHRILFNRDKQLKENRNSNSKERKSISPNFNTNLNVQSIKVNKTRLVWQYFSRVDNSKAQCDLCDKVNILYYSPRSYWNLFKHLQRKHKSFVDLAYNNSFRFTKGENAGTEPNRGSVQKSSGDTEDNHSSSGINMKVLYDYFSTDKDLGKFIKFDKEQIVCKSCTGTFLCVDLLNFEYTIKCHVQTCNVDSLSPNQSAMSPRSSPVRDDDDEELEEVLSNESYNELDAITNEINSYVR